MTSRTAPPTKAMAVSFWVIVPLALAVGIWLSSHAASFWPKVVVFGFSFWLTLRLLGFVSTLVLARRYKIPVSANPELDRRVQLRAKAVGLMEQLGIDRAGQSRLQVEFLFRWDDEEMVEFLEAKVRENRHFDANTLLGEMARFREAKVKADDEEIPF